MKKVITLIERLLSRRLGLQRIEVRVKSGRASDEHPMSTRWAFIGGRWKPAGNMQAFWKYTAMFVMLFTIGVGNAWGTNKTYTKITSTDDVVTGGKYLIVCEDQSRVFKASSASNGAATESESVTITSSTITCDETYAFTITGSTGSWKITGTNGSIGHLSGKNTLGVNTTVTNAITFDGSGNAEIYCDSRYLKCNPNSGSPLFRYYSTGQKTVQLYKESSGGGGCSAPAAPTISGTAAYTAGGTITLTASHDGSNHSASTNYTWYKGDTWGAATEVQSAATGSSGYTFTKATCVVGDAGTYWCEASNGTGCESHNATGFAITVSAGGGGGSNTFELVTDASDLSDGDEIVILNTQGDAALSTTQNNNNRSSTATGWSLEGTTVTVSGDNVEVLTLNETSGNWELVTHDNKYLYSVSNNNYLRTQTTNDATGVWSININASNEASIYCSSTSRYIKKNSSNALFSTYASGQHAIKIYKRTESGQTIYLKDNANWRTAPQAKYAVYYWDNSTNGWSEFMTAQTDCESVWKTKIPEGYTNMKFVRFNPSDATPGWNGDGHVYNQTGNLTIPDGKDCFTLPDGDWDGTGNGTSNANWSTYAQKVTVSFAAHAGSLPNPDDQCVVKTTGHASNVEYKWLGHQLNGWYTAETGGTQWNFDTGTFTENTTLHAQWNNSPTGTKIYLNTKWSTNSWRADNAVIFVHCTIDGTGQYDDIMMTVNECNSDIVEATVPYGTEKVQFVRNKQGTTTLAWEGANYYNKTGQIAIGTNYYYKITDWNAGSDNGSAYSNPPLSITFVGNGNTGGSMTNVENICSGDNRTLLTNGFTNTGSTFAGWKTNVAVTINTGGADQNIAANGIVPDEATIKNITSNITLTAQWNVIQDTYIDNIWNTATQTKTGTYQRPTIGDQTPGGLTDCQHLHYHFVGWITKTKYDEGTTIDARTAPTGDIVATGSVTADNTTYYAVWEKASAGGVSSYTELTDVSELAAGDHIIITDGVDAGMKAWSSGDNNCKEAAITISAGTITSIGDACELTLGGSSGHWTFHDGTYYIYAAGTAPTKSNYMKGNTTKDNACEWTITIDQGETSVVSVTNTNTPHMQYNSANSLFSCYNTESQSPVVLFRKPGVAFIDPIASCGEEYTITIDKNNASATCTSCGAKVNANATTLSNLVAPTWTGHQVDYYMVASANNSTKIAEADGTLAKSVASWTDGDGKWIKGSDATIYAKWKYAEYAIAYYDQGGSAFSGVHGTDHPTTHTYNTATTLVNPTKNGFTFGGWYTSSDCSSGLVTTLGATAYNSGPINLYAKWTLKTYDVTWVVNGSTVATQTSVTYGTTYADLSSTPSDPADNALSSCGSDRFVGWVTAEYTSEGGTKVSQYDPYKVTNSTVIDDTHHTFYAMFAKENGTAFTLSVTSGDFKISGLVDGVNYYATGALSNGKYGVTTTAASADEFTFTKVSDGVYTIKHKRSDEFVTWSSSTNFGEGTTSENWTITAANHGSWSVVPAGATTRAFVMNYSSSNPESNSVFKPYATSNVTNTPDQYYYIEIGNSNLTNYRTGCCSEKITLTVSDATSGAGGTVAMKWNNASKSSGDQVSTCSTGTLVVEVTANPSYTLTAITIAGTNKTITLTPSDLTTGLPSTSKMTYSVSVPSLATGTLTITPTFTRTYSVIYNLDGGETAGSTAVANYQSGATVTLVTPNPTRTGYNFTGWTINKAGGGTVTPSAGAFTMPAANVTVVAGWSEKTLSSISVASSTATIYSGQYVEIGVTYDPADILTKGYTTGSYSYVTITRYNDKIKLTGKSVTEDKVETVTLTASASPNPTTTVTVTVKPLPVDIFLDLIHGETFADQSAAIVDNALSSAYTAPGHADVSEPVSGNTCEKGHLHLIGWIESTWADSHLTATMSEITAAVDGSSNPLFHAVYSPMTVSGKTYYAVWAHEVTP